MPFSTISRLEPFSRRVRPTNADLLPSFMDEEFRRLADHSKDLVAAIKELDSRLRGSGR